MALTESAIRRLPAPEKPTLISDPATTGLYLRCYPTGRKTWLYRTRKGGEWKTQNLGLWPSVGMAQARAKAAALGTTVLPESVTFGQLLDEWFHQRIAPRYKQTKNAQVYVTKGKTWLGHQKLSQMTTQQLVQRLQTYAKASPVAANRCLSAWKLALDYATEVGYLTVNPLARTTTRAAGGEEKTRARVLTDDELRWVLRLEHRQYGPLLRALLLTGLRISEAQAGTTDHLDGGTWHIPENKSSRPHWVAVVPLLKKQFGNFDDYLFAVRSPTAVQTWMKRHGVGFTPHDLRRTFATRLAGLGVAPHVVEKCLNHQMQGVMATYNRHDYEAERKAAAIAWEAELKRINAKARTPT